MKEFSVDDILLDNICLDYRRHELCGIPEVIFGEKKTVDDIVVALRELTKKNGFSFATRVDSLKAKRIKKKLKSVKYEAIYFETARIFLFKKKDLILRQKFGPVGLVSAGTSDISVAEEARITLEILGCKVLRYYDIGVAGIHRFVTPLKEMKKKGVSCVIVVAGREAALPTLIKALIDVVVIGVPVSSGYGYGKDGISALMSILQSCSPGVLAVNIDNGFGAAVGAFLIAKHRKH